MWFVKSKRAQTSDDDETWVAGGVAPTLNAFDMGDTRATVIILMREREGKAGGGKGFLLSDDKAFTLATSNFHTVFLFEATRVDDVRIYPNYSPTVATYWGTGGARVPYVFPIQGTVIGRSDEAGPQGKGYGEDGEVMFTLDRVSGHGVAINTDKAYTMQVGGIGEESTMSFQEEKSYCLPANPMSDRIQSVGYSSSVVRRLTPTECERLQGFPDGWTDGQADSHRYKQMGNAVAVPVVQWIIDRLVK
jgi:DNA (cytosine-5)-methyltransferase 1